jgi:SMC interacting uncharacterized protein involved in chromosome segregation
MLLDGENEKKLHVAGERTMSKKPKNDEAFEALDFIINVLKEHEKGLDRLVAELGKTTGRLGRNEELSEKIEKVEERLSAIQAEISNLINHISTPQEVPVYSHGPVVIVRCKRWEDFKTLAINAETVSFLFKEKERTFQVDAIKEGKVLTYSGEFPRDTRLFRTWISKGLKIPEENIIEGVLAVG